MHIPRVLGDRGELAILELELCKIPVRRRDLMSASRAIITKGDDESGRYQDAGHLEAGTL